MKTIKSISTYRFAVRLSEMESGEYRIEHTNKLDSTVEGPSTSEPIRDLNNAMHMFDMKVAELEGN